MQPLHDNYFLLFDSTHFPLLFYFQNYLDFLNLFVTLHFIDKLANTEAAKVKRKN